MAICKFWSQGNCRFGDRCKFEHPDDRAPPSNNRYAPPNNPSNSRNVDTYRPSYNDNRNTRDINDGRQPGWPASIQTPAVLPFQLDKAAIITDLTSERPQWILSAYGPGRLAPAQLFGGPGRELSFEELRVAHYIGLASGHPQQAVQEAEQLVVAADQQIQQAVNKIDDAVEYIIRAENDHPNRLDIVTQSQANTGGPGLQQNPFQKPDALAATPIANPFGAASQPAANAFGAPSGSGAFGQPSALGQKPNPFGAPSAPTSAFGAPSALGQKPNPFGAASQPTTSAFGAPSALGQKPSPFGAPSATGGVFGAPSAMGQKPNPFGAPSSSTANQDAAGFSAFANKANPFAQKPTTSNTFGQPSQQNQPSPFGQTSSLAQDPSRGQNPPLLPTPSQPQPFGAPPPRSANPFVQAPPTAQSSGLNPFGAKTQPPTQLSTVNQNPFNATPGTAQQNTFATAQQNGVTNRNGLGQLREEDFEKAFQEEWDKNPDRIFRNGLGPPHPKGDPKPATAPGPSSQTELPDISKLSIHPPLESYSSKDANGRLTMFKGKRVIYNEDNKPTTKDADGVTRPIRFPNGPPDPVQGTARPTVEYDDGTKDAYAYFNQNGQFKDGVMPLLPPMPEWCQWDF